MDSQSLNKSDVVVPFYTTDENFSAGFCFGRSLPSTCSAANERLLYHFVYLISEELRFWPLLRNRTVSLDRMQLNILETPMTEDDAHLLFPSDHLFSSTNHEAVL